MGVRAAALVVAALAAVVWSAGCRKAPLGLEQGAARLARTAALIEADIDDVERLTAELSQATVECYGKADATLKTVRREDYAFAPSGVYFRKVQDGAPTVFVSGYAPIDADLKRVTWFTEAINPALIKVTRANPAVVQSYYNERRSLNRIYPAFDTVAQYEPKMNIPKFNFYYLADAKHNPGRKVVWVNAPYLDPAGRGWMVSCIAPVYVKDRLEGVVGLDVTVQRLTERHIPADGASLLVGPGGVIVSAGETALRLLNMPLMSEHRYSESVKSDQYQSEDFNLLKARTASVRTAAEQILRRGARRATFSVGNTQSVILAVPLPALGWSAWSIASEQP
ncbi:MAG: hypothetical protein NT029_13300 [Armatimonadetes bacterium]|nr:hypothetical protein [Armatimonadota bacterium]